MAFGTREELRRALLRLVGTEADDPELELRGEAANEVVDAALEVGLWNAQRFLVDIGCGDIWLTSATPSFGAADATGARSAAIEDDLLRFAGDGEYPALYKSNGTPWGRLLQDLRKRRFAHGDWFYFADNKLWVAPEAQVVDGLMYDYYERLSLPAAGTETDIDLPVDVRPLVPAEAAWHAMHEYWIPAASGDRFEERISRNRAHKRTEAAAAMRRTTGRQHLNDPQPTGSHYFL